MCLSCEDIARQRCAMVPRWRSLATFLRPVFAASRKQHISDLHSSTRATPCVEVWQTSNLWPLRLGEEKKEDRRRKKEMVCPLVLHAAAACRLQGAHTIRMHPCGCWSAKRILLSLVTLTFDHQWREDLSNTHAKFHAPIFFCR